MFKIKKRISDLKPYPLTSHQIYKKKLQFQSIKLDWNEFPYDPCPKVIMKIKEEISSKSLKLNWYPNTYPENLLRKVASYNNVSKDNICLFSGSDAGLELIAKTFIEKNTTVGIISPTYDQFRIECIINNAKLKKIFFKNLFQSDLKELGLKLKKIKPKIVYLANPNNPTGTMFNNEKLIELIKLNSNILFIIDEAYIEYTNHKSIATKKNLNDTKNLIVMRTFSKCFALASLRLGYCLTSKLLNTNLNKIKNHKSINSIAQLAGISTLDNILYYKKKIKLINKTKNNFIDKLSSYGINIINTPTNYVLIESVYKDELIKFLESKNIFIRNLNHLKFMNNFARISIGKKSDMIYVANCIINFFKKSK